MQAAQLKQILGRKVIDELVREGMKLGLGSGTTAMEAAKRLGELYSKEKLGDIVVVPTSYETEMECRKCGIPILTLNDPKVNGSLDLAIDGADEVDPDWNLIKGRWGAMLLEKIIAYCSDRFAVIVDDTKCVQKLGKECPIPVEIVPEALLPVTKTFEALDGRVQLRMAKMKGGPVISEHGNFILDVAMDIGDPVSLEREIKLMPGVVESGLFCERTTEIFVGHSDGRVAHKQKNS